MQICRRGRKDPCWCSSRHRRHLGSRLCRSSAQVRPKTNGETASRKGCRRPAEPNRVVSRRDVVRCLSCLHRKVPEQFLGEGVRVTEPPYPTQKAKAGDVTALPRMRAILAEHPEIWQTAGDLEQVVVRSWAELLGGDDP